MFWPGHRFCRLRLLQPVLPPTWPFAALHKSALDAARGLEVLLARARDPRLPGLSALLGVGPCIYIYTIYIYIYIYV